MADGYDDATSQRAYMYPMRQTGRSQLSSATLTGSTLGDYGNIHQGDQNINIEQIRNITNNYAYLPPQTRSHQTFDPHPDRPRTPSWTVPFGRNKDFVGRESILDQLLGMIPPTADEDDCQRTVISGLGGIGKTQIALEAAFRVRSRYRDCHVFWVPAINTTTFENAYHEIGRELNIQIIEDNEDDKADIKLLVKAALSQISDSWLLIIDNADDATLFGEASEVTSLRDYLPFNLKGSILFTTRNVEVSQKLDVRKENIIHLTQMSQSEATNMLQRSLTQHQMSDAQSLDSLLEFLTNLPLAIKQASAYMMKTGITIPKYLEYCRRSSDEQLIELLSKNFDDRARYETTQNPIATTWLISFRKILRDNPLAASYLRFMAFLAEKDIPKHLFSPASDGLGAYEAIGTLKAYGFIGERECGDAYDMHRLVRLAMQNWMRGLGELQKNITTVMQRFDEEVPVPLFSNKDQWARCLPHMTMALKFQNHVVDQIPLWSILHKAACGFFILGKYRDAKEMKQKALDLHIEALGGEHPATLEIMDESLTIAACEGQPAEVEQIGKRLLELRRTVLGPEHPRTLWTMYKLSEAFNKLKHYERAAQMSRQALDLQIRVLGAEHYGTLATMCTLSIALDGQGYYKDAEQISRQALGSLMKTKKGFEHSETLKCMDSLFSALNHQGHYKEAEQISRQTLQLRVNVLGVKHLSTLKNMSSLSFFLLQQDRFKESEQMSRRVLDLLIQVLGVEHPYPLEIMYRLSTALYYQGHYKEAEQIIRQTFELQVKVSGAEDPETLRSMYCLCLILCEQRRFKEAEQINRQALNLHTRVMGTEHLGTRAIKSCLSKILIYL